MTTQPISVLSSLFGPPDPEILEIRRQERREAARAHQTRQWLINLAGLLALVLWAVVVLAASVRVIEWAF